MLNHYKTQLNYLSTISKNVHSTTTNLIKDNIALLELTFEYTIWYQPHRNINESQVIYCTDDRN